MICSALYRSHDRKRCTDYDAVQDSDHHAIFGLELRLLAPAVGRKIVGS